MSTIQGVNYIRRYNKLSTDTCIMAVLLWRGNKAIMPCYEILLNDVFKISTGRLKWKKGTPRTVCCVVHENISNLEELKLIHCERVCWSIGLVSDRFACGRCVFLRQWQTGLSSMSCPSRNQVYCNQCFIP